jgi:hypothetical protein
MDSLLVLSLLYCLNGMDDLLTIQHVNAPEQKGFVKEEGRAATKSPH